MMQRLRLVQSLSVPSPSKILFWVFDGLGGLPHPETGLSELETADLPALDDFARRSSCGAHEPCGPGVTVGSGLGHMALFGYPVEALSLPRGALEVLGSEEAFEQGALTDDLRLGPADLAIRGNFARLSRPGPGEPHVIADRRAQAISSAQSRALCEHLSAAARLPGLRCRWVPGRDHRFALILSGETICAGISDTDPQRSGLAALPCRALKPEARRCAETVNALVAQVERELERTALADTILLRGAGHAPQVPTLKDLYGLRAAAIAAYPVYNGVARLVGMQALKLPTAAEPEDQLRVLSERFEEYDFFFFHIKATDSLAHRGDFKGKVAYFERCDRLFAIALALGFDVVLLTGDHATPSVMGEHSWHPVPTALWSSTIFSGQTERFTERACSQGSLGLRRARDLMPLALAEARRLKAYGP